MVKTYLEKQIVKSLEENDLISNSKEQLYYRPANIGGSYRTGRQWLIKNSQNLCVGGLAITATGAAITSLLVPGITGWLTAGVAAGIGGASILGYLGRSLVPLDRYLYAVPSDIARRYFRYVDVPWNKAYSNFSFKSKSELDNYVYMAQTPIAVKQEFQHHDSQVSLGVTIAAIADQLSQLDVRESKITGFKLEHLVEIITRQKVGTPQETEAIKRLSEQFSSKDLASFLSDMKARGIRYNKFRAKISSSVLSDLEVLDSHSQNYEFALRISEAEGVESIGAQLSRGSLIVTNDIGPNACSYGGMHSKEKDFPRMRVNDDCEHSLATHAKCGLYVINGTAQQGVLGEATGGIAIIEGTAEHNFAHLMNDTN